MAPKRTILTQEQFDRLSIPDGWLIYEVPREFWEDLPGIQRLDETIAVMASGCASDPGFLNRIPCVAGMDVLVHEINPLTDEPPGNAYHYVFQRTNHTRHPYVMHGPFRLETVVPHWFNAEDLDRYKWE